MTTSQRLTWTVVEAAELLGLKERSVRDYCERGLLPAIQVGRRWLLPVRGLEDWIARQSGLPSEPHES